MYEHPIKYLNCTSKTVGGDIAVQIMYHYLDGRMDGQGKLICPRRGGIKIHYGMGSEKLQKHFEG